MTMKAARDLAKKRWEGKSDEEKKAHAQKMRDARQAGTTAEQRSEAARVAAEARWGTKGGAKKKSARKKAT
jgi:hypothetical protein